MSRIAYLMSHYPAVSHAFVLREIEALRREGVDVATISIRRARPEDLLAPADRREASTTHNILPTSARRLLRAHTRALLRAPGPYLSALGLALRTGSPGLRGRLWHLFYFAEGILLAEHCRAAGIDHVHAQFADSATDAAMLASHYLAAARPEERTTWSLAVHGSVEFYNVIAYGLRVKLARASFAVAISDFGRSQLMTLSEPERWEHIHVVRCAVDTVAFRPPAGRSASATGAEVLCVGRLLPGKGLTLLLAAVAALRRAGLDVRLTLVGDGPARAALEETARREGVAEHVRFLGALGQDDVREHYAHADVFCLPSFAEGIPVVAMEAMAMELPVVSTRIMGLPELIEEGVDGILIRPGRTDELTAALEGLIRDPATRARLGRAGRAKIEREYESARSARALRAALASEGILDAPPGGSRPRVDELPVPEL